MDIEGFVANARIDTAGMRTHVAAVWLLALAACPAPTGPQAPARPEPLPWLVDDEALHVEPALDAAGVGRALTGALPIILLGRAGRVMDTYASLAPDGAACADEHEVEGDAAYRVEYWETEGCTTADGTTFRGAALISRFVDQPRDEGGTESGFEISSEGDILVVEGADGRALRVTGYLAVTHGTDGASTDASVYWSGTFELEDGGDVPPLLRGELSGQLEAYAYREDADYRVLTAEGAVAGAPLAPATAVGLSGFEVSDEDCAEPAGTLSLRDENAVWHDVTFDNSSEDDADLAVCDGCGAWSVGGANAGGDVCLDAGALDPLLVWSDLPW